MKRHISLLIAATALVCGSVRAADAAMSGRIDLWQKGNIPTVTHNVNNSDGPDFIPNLGVFTVADYAEEAAAKEVTYNLYGQTIPEYAAQNGIYIVRHGHKTAKILKR